MHIEKKFLGAFKKGHRKNVREYIDEDFARELLKKAVSGCEESRRALEWASKFNNEYHKGIVKVGDESALHNTKDMRLDCYRRAYASRCDIFYFVKKIGNVA